MQSLFQDYTERDKIFKFAEYVFSSQPNLIKISRKKLYLNGNKEKTGKNLLYRFSHSFIKCYKYENPNITYKIIALANKKDEPEYFGLGRYAKNHERIGSFVENPWNFF